MSLAYHPLDIEDEADNDYDDDNNNNNDDDDDYDDHIVGCRICLIVGLYKFSTSHFSTQTHHQIL